jgi:hypothetical protein
MTDEQKDKNEDLSVEELAQVTGGVTFPVVPVKLPDPAQGSTGSNPSGWDMTQNKKT